MRILITGGAEKLAIGSNRRYIGRIVGLVDYVTMMKAEKLGINIEGGSTKGGGGGRVLIFVKDKFPGAYKGGYALRSHVVWWLNTGEIIGPEFDIHHKKGKLDDRFSQLEKIDHIKHSHYHNPKTVVMVRCRCKKCGKIFRLEQWRLKDKSRGQYCSPGCYQIRERLSTLVSKNCMICGKVYICPPSQVDKRKTCSYKCAVIFRLGRGE